MHGGWARGDGEHLGDVQFDAKTGEYFRTNIQFPFFEHYLKGHGVTPPKAVVFETGTNVWRTFDSWPPKTVTSKTLYFHADGKLSFDPPTDAKGADEYVSDPNHPVPFVGYTTDTVPQRYMVDDQRFASYRTDVLVYETDPLQEDVTIAGPISPKLKVASSGTDSDFDVKLIDVYPEDYPDADDTPHGNKRISDAPPLHMGGYEQLLRGEPFRAKFRNSWEKPEPLVPGQEDRRLISRCPTSFTRFAAAIASWSRCKVHGSRSPIAIRKSSPTYHPRLLSSSRKQPSRFFARRMQPRALNCRYCSDTIIPQQPEGVPRS